MVLQKLGSTTLTLLDIDHFNLNSENEEDEEEIGLDGDPKKEILILRRTIKSLKDEVIREREINHHLRCLLSVRSKVSLHNGDDNDGNGGDSENSVLLSQSQPLTPGQKPRMSVSSDGSESHDENPPHHPVSPHDPLGSNPDNLHDKKDKTPQSPPGDRRGDPKDDHAKIHDRCAKPATKLSYILNAFKNLPKSRTTVFVGDSNFHCIKGELDPVKKFTAVRAVSGLCIAGAAQTLKEYKFQYPNIKKIVYSLGVNDYLHKVDHCEEDLKYHLATLIEESRRVFSSAKIHFIVPFKGLPRVPLHHVQKVWNLLKTEFPDVKRHEAPSMEGKVQPRDGVHLNGHGARSLQNFLVERFTRYKPDQHQISDRRANDRSYESRATYDLPRASDRVYRQQYSQPPNAWGQPEDRNQHFPPLFEENPERMVRTSQREETFRDLSQALASVMMAHLHRHA